MDVETETETKDKLTAAAAVAFLIRALTTSDAGLTPLTGFQSELSPPCSMTGYETETASAARMSVNMSVNTSVSWCTMAHIQQQQTNQEDKIIHLFFTSV